MTATLNGKDILSVSIQEPRVGVWTAVVDVDSDEAISGTVKIAIDGVEWTGTISRGDLHAGRFRAQIVGGAGKLATVLDAQYYIGIPLSVVLDDLMMGTGEKLSATSSTLPKSHYVPRWARPQGKASDALRQIADELSLTWRVLRDGTVWLGTESWPTDSPTYDEIDRVPGRDSVSIAPDAPTVAPGHTFLDKHVSRVTTAIKDAGLRQEILFEGDSGGSRVSADMAAIVGTLVDNRIDYSRLYPCKVVKQASDGSLELLPDSAKMRGNGLTRVPIRHGIPGLHVTVPAGGKVLLFFEAGDPKLPAVALWPTGESVSEIRITTPKLIVDGDIECTGEITAKSQSAPVKLTTHTHNSAVGPTAPPNVGS